MQNLPEPDQTSSNLPAPVPRPVSNYAPAPPFSAASESEDSVGLLEYWRILRRRKGAIILLACMGVILGVLITLPQTPVYQARASLEVQDINQDFLNMKEVSQEAQTYTALTDIQTQIKILQSETITNRTLAKLKIATPTGLKVPESRFDVWRKALNLPEQLPMDPHQRMLKAAAKSLKVRASGQTRIIEILVDSTDPSLAADFANTLTNEYIDQNMEARYEMSQRTGDWLGRELDGMRVKLEHSEDALQDYARRAGLVFTGSTDGDKDNRQNVSEAKLSQIQQSLSAASADRVARQSRYEMASTSPAQALPDVLNDSNLRDYQSKLTDLKRQIADLSTTYTPDYPKVKRLQAEAQTLQTELGGERADILKRIKNDYDEALRREKLLADQYAQQSALVTQEGEKTIQYNILQREVDSNRQLYESMLQRVKESAIAAALKASNIRVVDAARIPPKPYKPDVPINAGLGLCAGLFIGVAFVVMRERADRTFQAPGDCTFWLDVPELGVIPSDRAVGRKSLYYYGYGDSKRLSKTKEPSTDVMAPSGRKLPEMLELNILQRKSSFVAEAFRAVLTSIMFSGENGSRPRVLVVTSAGPSEGKTTICCNLAIAMAEIGRSVLLIDADIRKPRVHSVFGLENDRGLVDILKAGTLADDLINSLVQPTSVPGLSTVTSGPATAAAANLLFASHMPDLLARFRKEYDLVLVDTPPMLAMADARVVGRMADAVLMVVRANHTTRDAAQAAQQRFAKDDTRVLGTILNDWNPKSSPNGYYGYYDGYYSKYSSHYYKQTKG